MKRARAQWLTDQPKEIQKLAKVLEDHDPKEIVSFAKSQLIGNLFAVAVHKEEMYWALAYAMEYARRQKKPEVMVSAARCLASIESKSIEMLRALDNQSFNVKGENVQINNYAPGTGTEPTPERAREVIARAGKVSSGNGALPLDGEPRAGSIQGAEDRPVHPE